MSFQFLLCRHITEKGFTLFFLNVHMIGIPLRGLVFCKIIHYFMHITRLITRDDGLVGIRQ